MRKDWGSLCLAAWAVCGLALAAPPDAGPVDDWIAGDGSLMLPAPQADPARLRVTIGETDYSAQMSADDTGHLRLQGRPVRLPAGEQSLTLYAVQDDGRWQELSRLPLRVLSRGGFEQSEFQPRADLNNESLWREEVSGDAFASDPDHYHNLAGTGGLSTHQTRSGWSLRSEWSLTGNSRRESALQFFNRGERADKVDLASYRIDIASEALSIGIGHVSLGRNALLMDKLNQRGVVASWQASDWLDLQAGAVNGSQIVGFDHFLGIQTRDNLITGYSLGLNLPTGGLGQLRLELSLSDSEVASDPGFDVGELRDNERSRGRGMLLRYASPGDSLNLEGLYARSRYHNPFDAGLAFDGELVPVEEAERAARRLSMNWSPLSYLQFGDGWTANLSLSASHDQADPLYQSIGAFVSGDQRNDRYSLSASLGISDLNLSLSRARDNLDNLANLLTTRTRQRGGSLRIGLDRLGWLRLESWGGSLLPGLDLSWDRTHQFAANDPAAEDSGFNGGSHLPDQVTERRAVGLSWNFARASLSYRRDLSEQDNRQTGREDADFDNRSNSISLSLRPWDRLSLDLNLSDSDNQDLGAALTRENRSNSASLNWQITDNGALSARWFNSNDEDSLGNAEAENRSSELNLNWNLRIPLGGARAAPISLYMRYARQENASRDHVFDFASAGESWTLQSGVSASLF